MTLDSYAVFKRAIERGYLLVAGTTLRVAIQHPSLGDLLELTVERGQEAERFSRVAARRLFEYLERVDDCTIDNAAFFAAALLSLGGRHHEQALTALRDVNAFRRRSSRGA